MAVRLAPMVQIEPNAIDRLSEENFHLRVVNLQIT
jgi:hypothetical protein